MLAQLQVYIASDSPTLLFDTPTLPDGRLSLRFARAWGSNNPPGRYLSLCRASSRVHLAALLKSPFERPAYNPAIPL